MMDLKKTPYWNIYAEIFTFFKESMPVQEDDPYWDRVIKEADQIYNKYKDTDQGEFAKREVLSVIDELETIYKRRKRGEAS